MGGQRERGVLGMFFPFPQYSGLAAGLATRLAAQPGLVGLLWLLIIEMFPQGRARQTHQLKDQEIGLRVVAPRVGYCWIAHVIFRWIVRAARADLADAAPR